ncbi:nucleotidyltransferase substrate binding protein, HI0074 family [Thermosinus carboxydivorans Nor1]|uniref:Nucleotidyltransferase substrate binding protein, HI0074 family n=1 Tax=Thermosinus carboxydivorans Nor1 TaxID=401526 RepID=A1HM99_9FIRM|nr:HI0074 family nucleotidyltransferase substrate-binding subunit [Thermosinus carboxydivorans]EAX48945.1 nucleotidyltransferase substrate binding protein, HI0074 family [Thermosinus carboxydivorans Nor1]
MARIHQRLELAARTLTRLEETLAIEQPTLVERDAAIQRFEFTFEAVWKAAKDYLFTLEGVDVASPKGVIRHCREVGILTDEEAQTALLMADDRNLTVHTYNEPLAVAIHSRLPAYRAILANWLARMQERVLKL